jgi:hypothetical protein
VALPELASTLPLWPQLIQKWALAKSSTSNKDNLDGGKAVGQTNMSAFYLLRSDLEQATMFQAIAKSKHIVTKDRREM